MALTLSKVDHDALRRAMVEASCDPVKAKQLAGIEGDRGLIEAQMQAAYSCQTRNLTCKPWESPPCFGDASPGHDGHIAGAKLLKRLLDAGLKSVGARSDRRAGGGRAAAGGIVMDKNEALAWALTVPGVTRAWWSPLEDEMWPILKSDLVCEAPQTVATPEVIPDLARPAPDLPAKVESAVSDQAPKSPEVRKDFFVLAPIQQFIDVVIEPPRRHF